MSTLTLEPWGVLRLRWDSVPAAEQVAAAKAIPGARLIEGGYEWGWWNARAVELIQHPLLAPTMTGNWPPAGWATWKDQGFGPEGWTWVDPAWVAATPWRSPTPPRPHQLAFKAWRRGGGRDGLYHPGALVEAGMGTGKTLLAIEEILELIQHRPQARILVLTRNSLIETTWAPQLEQHAPGLPYVLLNKSRKVRMSVFDELDMAPSPYPIVAVHSHEELPAFGKVLASYEWDMIVIDETTYFRTASAQRTGRMTGYQAKPLTAPYRLGLSGLPIVKSAADAYPILRWLGAPTGNKQQFVERFMAEKPYSKELVLHDPEGLRSLLDAWRFQVPKGAVLSIPRAWHYERVKMEPWQRSLYKKVQKRLQDFDTEELAGGQLEQLLRLAQVTAGFDGVLEKDDPVYLTSNAKLTHLVSKVLPELGEDQVIIWTRFQQEALGVAKALRAARKSADAYTGAQSDEANRRAYGAFTGGSCQYFVATLSKGAMGLNLPMARHMVYLTRDFNTEQMTQSLERNYRLTTTAEVLNVVVIEAEDSVDQKITDILGDDLRMAAQLTALDVREVLGS